MTRWRSPRHRNHARDDGPGNRAGRSTSPARCATHAQTRRHEAGRTRSHGDHVRQQCRRGRSLDRHRAVLAGRQYRHRPDRLAVRLRHQDVAGQLRRLEPRQLVAYPRYRRRHNRTVCPTNGVNVSTRTFPLTLVNDWMVADDPVPPTVKNGSWTGSLSPWYFKPHAWGGCVEARETDDEDVTDTEPEDAKFPTVLRAGFQQRQRLAGIQRPTPGQRRSIGEQELPGECDHAAHQRQGDPGRRHHRARCAGIHPTPPRRALGMAIVVPEVAAASGVAPWMPTDLPLDYDAALSKSSSSS